ncbi:MAG: type I 3-dehydroquinate dehydratase, partial [Clostridia bacterium]|nr:type I 3-dehydroquinate dehydratase [Clostridia bacterium]
AANAYEPGSTFKIFSLMVAIEDGVVDTNTMVDTYDGIYKFSGRNMVDHNHDKGGYGKITVAQGLAYSSNIVVSRVIEENYGNRKEKFVNRLYEIGLNRTLDIEIPGIQTPKIKHPKDSAVNWYGTTLPWMSIGYEVQIPPIYTLAYYNAIANDGVFVQPFLIKNISKSGEVIESFETKIINSSKLPILALYYDSVYEAEDPDASEEKRVETFLRAVKAGASGIDIQGYTYDLLSKSKFCGEDKYSFTKNNPKEIITNETIISKQCELIEKVHFMGAEVLLSCHPDIPMKCEQVVDLALFLEKRNPDIIKIVTKATSDDDLVESIKTMLTLKKEIKTPISYHVNGAKGMLSRIITPVLGGQIAFCVDRYKEDSVLEQVDLRTAKTVIENINKIL